MSLDAIPGGVPAADKMTDSCERGERENGGMSGWIALLGGDNMAQALAFAGPDPVRRERHLRFAPGAITEGNVRAIAAAPLVGFAWKLRGVAVALARAGAPLRRGQPPRLSIAAGPRRTALETFARAGSCGRVARALLRASDRARKLANH